MKANWIRRGALMGALALVVLGLSVVIASCGGDDDDDGGAGTPTAAATIGKLSIINPWARTTTNDVTAAYFTIKNSGAEDTLVSVKSNITGMVQLHEVVTEGSTSKMQEKPGGFVIPANGELTLKAGGYHVMLMNLKSPLNVGDNVELELTFKNAGTVKVTAPVQQGEAMTGTDMGK